MGTFNLFLFPFGVETSLLAILVAQFDADFQWLKCQCKMSENMI
jgi:hypothetical protein